MWAGSDHVKYIDIIYVNLKKLNSFYKVLAFGIVVCVRYTVYVYAVDPYIGGGVGEGQLVTIGGGKWGRCSGRVGGVLCIGGGGEECSRL